MNVAYLSLGSNEGNRMQWMQKAMVLLTENCGRIIAQSSVYETAAWGVQDQSDFLNMVIELETKHTPEELLEEIHNIENQLGRQRNIKWGPRTLDIDILLFNEEIIKIPELTIPHPYLGQRLFTLKPLSEIAPGYIHPLLNKSVIEMLKECPDDLAVTRYTKS